MKEYKIYDFDGELKGIVQANSFEDAFNKALGDYPHMEVSSDKAYDIYIECENSIKYLWIRFG